MAHLYPTDPAAATPALSRVIRGRIEASGSLSFADFMAAALYEPNLGYYARGLGQTGRGGDFYTSVSVGPLFGRLLANRFVTWWSVAGSPEAWRIVEVGAHDGTLAGDVLKEISALDSKAFDALEYLILEPLERLRETQLEALAGFAGMVRIVEDPVGLEPLDGIVFGNEVLDALPFRIVEKREDRWVERRVGMGDSAEFAWKDGELDPGRLPKILTDGSVKFPTSYRTEVRDFAGFLQPFRMLLKSGLLVFPDYGYARPEYFHPDRTTGTLRTFSKHQAAEDPLVRPGQIDITAHVDFTTLAEQAISLGFRPTCFQSQGSWLTGLARDWLLAQEGNPGVAGLRQFQSLTHPGHLGSRFQVIELAWKDPAVADLSAAEAHRLGL